MNIITNNKIFTKVSLRSVGDTNKRAMKKETCTLINDWAR